MSISQRHLAQAGQKTHPGSPLNQALLRHENRQSAYVHSQFLLLELPKYPYLKINAYIPLAHIKRNPT